MNEQSDEKLDHAADAYAAEALFDEIRPLLGGKGAGVQGAALAQLVALHIAGHILVTDKPDEAAEAAQETAKLREDLLAEHINLVRQLIPIVEAQYIAPALQGRADEAGAGDGAVEI